MRLNYLGKEDDEAKETVDLKSELVQLLSAEAAGMTEEFCARRTVQMHSSDSPRLAIAACGTGGHIFPGIALAEEMRRNYQRVNVLFFAAPGALEEGILGRRGYRIAYLPSLKLTDTVAAAPGLPFKAGWGLLRARTILKRFRAEAVVGCGGYGMVLPVAAARSLGLPSVILEQNSIPGRATRLMARIATCVVAQFPEARARLPAPERVAVYGSPLRRSLLAAAARRRRAYIPTRTLLVLGGSQGARALNDLMIATLPLLKRALPNLRVVHLTGAHDQQRVADAYSACPLEAAVMPFADDMAPIYERADLALCRAGATTIAELALFGIPALLVPYPYAKDGHQEKNALLCARAGAAVTYRESELNPEQLAAVLATLMSSSTTLREMGQRALAVARPDAGASVLHLLETIVAAQKQRLEAA